MNGEVPSQPQEQEIALPSGERELAARTLVEERLRSIRRALDRDVDPVDLVLQPTPSESRSYLFEEACELYLNELSWEELTEEEKVEDGELTEMVFPGLLAFVDALLPRAPNGEPDRDREHRDVVHDFLLWLADRLVRLRHERLEEQHERTRALREAGITDDLIDLVAGRLYGLEPEEMDRLRH